MEAKYKAIELVEKYVIQTNDIDKAKLLASEEVDTLIKSSYAYSLSEAYGRFMEDPFLTEVVQEIQNYEQTETLEEWKAKFTHHCAIKLKHK